MSRLFPLLYRFLITNIMGFSKHCAVQFSRPAMRSPLDLAPCNIIMNFQILSLLSQLPSKKYVRKLLEYAYLFRNKLFCFQEFMETPVSAQMPADLQLDELRAHQVPIPLALDDLFAGENHRGGRAARLGYDAPESELPSGLRRAAAADDPGERPGDRTTYGVRPKG